jgi:hypothetical protein
MKPCPSGTTPSNLNCEVVLAQRLSIGLLHSSHRNTIRGYIQHWLKSEKEITNHTAARIFAAATSILKAGTPAAGSGRGNWNQGQQRNSTTNRF